AQVGEDQDQHRSTLHPGTAMPRGADPRGMEMVGAAAGWLPAAQALAAFDFAALVAFAAGLVAGALRVAVVLERNGVGARVRRGVFPITSMRPPRLRKAAMSSAMDWCDMLFAATGLDGWRAIGLLRGREERP